MTQHYALNSLINAIVGNEPVARDDQEATFEVAKRQYKLIHSEFEEFLAGYKAKDISEVRDGLADIIVTVDGMYYRLNLDYPNVALWGGAIDYTVDDYVRSIEVDLEDIRKRIEIGLGEENLAYYRFEIKTRCDAILWSVYHLSRQFGIDLDADQQAIFESNMSKFDTDMITAEAGVAKYEALGVKTAVYPNRVNSSGAYITHYVIKCTEDCVGTDNKRYGVGKFLKSVNFREPVLAPLAEDAHIRFLFAEPCEAV